MNRKQSGFTLIEIAIVLVIIGLLLGGILKGQELINSGKVKNLAQDFKNIPVYIYGYQDKFKAMPGDDPNAVVHSKGKATLASTPAGLIGNGVIDGAWNSTTQTDETYLFWQQVRLAKLASGSTDPADPGYLPTNSMGGVIGVQSATDDVTKSPVLTAAGEPIQGTTIVCSSGILGKFAVQLDTQMDDGNPGKGSMLAVPTNGYALGKKATPIESIDEAASYIVCIGI